MPGSSNAGMRTTIFLLAAMWSLPVLWAVFLARNVIPVSFIRCGASCGPQGSTVKIHSTLASGGEEPPRLVAGLDIGSSATKLVVAEVVPQDSSALQPFTLGRKLLDLEIIVPYGVIWKMSGNGELTEAIMAEGLAALRNMTEAISLLQQQQAADDPSISRVPTLVKAVGTEVFRAATNGATFLDRIKRETGISVELVSQQQEAWLGYLSGRAVLQMVESAGVSGCEISSPEMPLVVYDSGGGSFQLSRIPSLDDQSLGAGSEEKLQTFLCRYAASQILSDLIKVKAKARLPGQQRQLSDSLQEEEPDTGMFTMAKDVVKFFGRPIKRGVKFLGRPVKRAVTQEVKRLGNELKVQVKSAPVVGEAKNLVKQLVTEVVLAGVSKTGLRKPVMKEVLVKLVLDLPLAAITPGIPDMIGGNNTPMDLLLFDRDSLRDSLQGVVTTFIDGIFGEAFFAEEDIEESNMNRETWERTMQNFFEELLLGPTSEVTAHEVFEIVCGRIREFAELGGGEEDDDARETAFKKQSKWLRGAEVLAICGPNYPQRTVLRVLGRYIGQDGDINGNDGRYDQTSFTLSDVQNALQRLYDQPMDRIAKRYCNYADAPPAFTVMPALILVKAVMATLEIERVHVRSCTGVCPGLLLSMLTELEAR